MVDFSANAFCSDCPVGNALDFAARQFVIAFRIAALDGDLDLVAGLRRLIAGNAVSGRTPSVLNPMSRMMESAVTAMTVPSRRWLPASALRDGSSRTREKMSLKDSVRVSG